MKNTIDAALDKAIRNLNNIVSRGMRMERRPVDKERYLTIVFMVAIAIGNPKIAASRYGKVPKAFTCCIRMSCIYHVSKFSSDRTVAYLDNKKRLW